MAKILGYNLDYFNPKYLDQALSHRSYGKINNEKLEFLGDSVLSFVIAKWLFNKFPEVSEGKLSRMRSQLVKGETLSSVALHYNLGDHLKLGVGELKSGGHKRKSVLEDCLEAIFAAVLLDKGYQECESFILKIMEQWLAKADPSMSDKDSKTQLQELLQGQSIDLAQYALTNEFGKDHLKEFEIEAQVQSLNLKVKARARSIKKAEQICAKMLLDKMKL